MSDRFKPLLTGAAMGGALAVSLSLFGVELPFAVAWGIIVVVAFAVARPLMAETIPSWPPKRDPRRTRGSEVSRLSWAFNARTGLVGRGLVHRVRRLVSARLARRGLDLDDPSQQQELDALLGAGMREALSRDALRVDVLERVLDVAERLSVAGLQAPAQRQDPIEEDRWNRER